MPEHMSDKLNAFLDGELDMRTQSEVLAHLDTCQSCTDELEALRRVSQILRAAPQPEFTPADAFKDRLMLQLPRREEALPQADHTANWLLWLAPVIVLGGLDLHAGDAEPVRADHACRPEPGSWKARWPGLPAARSRRSGSPPRSQRLKACWACRCRLDSASSMMPVCSRTAWSPPCSGRRAPRRSTGLHLPWS